MKADIQNERELQDYLNQLYNIQDKNPTVTAILLPADEKIYNVDLNSRTIEKPSAYNMIESDHISETIYFKVPRYFDNMDMANTVCVIQYINAKKEPYIYAVPYYDTVTYSVCDRENGIEEPVMLIPWRVSNTVTAKAGSVTFAMQFYILAEDKKHYLYNLNTLPQTMLIQKGVGVDNDVISKDLLVNKEALDFEAFLEEAKSYQRDVYWTVLQG